MSKDVLVNHKANSWL